MIRFTYIIFGCFLCFYSNGQTDQTLSLSLEKLLQLTNDNSLKIKGINLKNQLATDEYNLAKDWWIPKVKFGIKTHQLTGYAMNGDGGFFTDVDRQSFWGGGGVGIKLDFAKGLINAQSEKIKVEAKQFESQAEKNKIMLELVHLFYEFQAAEALLKAQQNLVDQSEKIVQQLSAHYEVGLTQKSDLLLAKSNLNHYKIGLKKAQILRQNSEAELKANMNLGAEIILIESSGGDMEMIDLVNENKINSTNLRPEIQHIELLNKSLQTQKKTVTTGLLLPKIQLNYSNYLFGDLFSPTNRQGEIIDKLSNTWDFNAGVMWKIPLSDVFGGKQRKIYETQTQIYQNQTQQFEYIIQAEIQQFSEASKEGREAVQLANESLEFAKEALNLSLERQKLRTAKPYEVFQAQEVYFRALKDSILSIKKFNQSQYSLWVALGNNF